MGCSKVRYLHPIRELQAPPHWQFYVCSTIWLASRLDENKRKIRCRHEAKKWLHTCRTSNWHITDEWYVPTNNLCVLNTYIHKYIQQYILRVLSCLCFVSTPYFLLVFLSFSMNQLLMHLGPSVPYRNSPRGVGIRRNAASGSVTWKDRQPSM